MRECHVWDYPNRLLMAQDVLKSGNGSAFAGFNRRVHGETYADAFQYDNERQDAAMVSGYWCADRLINEGRIYYKHNFHQSHEGCSGYAFQYGGSMVCNTCGRNNLAKSWWNIKVFQDGNAWCCIGEGFTNLQESNNYAFGDTRDEAIKGYGDLMTAISD